MVGTYSKSPFAIHLYTPFACFGEPLYMALSKHDMYMAYGHPTILTDFLYWV
jgi:hypothetical protein